MILLPGVQERLDRRAETRPARLVPVPISVAKAASGVRLVDSQESARELLHELKSLDLAAIALDSEYGFDRSSVPLRNGEWRDIRSQRPICFSLAAWAQDGSIEGFVVRGVLDVREPPVVAVLGEILRLRVPFVFHHAKVDLFSLWALGLDPVLHQVYDTFVAAEAIDLGLGHKRARKAARHDQDADQIRNETELNRRRTFGHSLVGQCAQYELGYPLTEAKDGLRDRFLRFGEGQPLDQRAVEYAAADAEWTLRLYVAQQPELLRRGLHSHLYTVEFPFTVANSRIEWNGIYIDGEQLQQVRDAARGAAEHYAKDLARYGINPPGSRPKFLMAMEMAGMGHLFVKRGRPTTEDRLLETLEDAHAAVRALRLYRRYSRLAGEEWLTGSLVGADGRTHPIHRQLGAATGRNSCSTPNIAGIGRALRPVVTAPPGRALVELDYSQIEVGVAAAEHGDEGLITAFNSGDVYAAMAQRFYEVDLSAEECELTPVEFKSRRPELREKIKTFVLAVIYNIQAPAIAARFSITVGEAEKQRDRFLALYPALRNGLEEAAAFGAIRGFASTVSGLRRHRESRGTADTWTKNFLRNTPIQGSAAVVFKKAVVDLDRAFRGTSSRLVVPVHDSILIECDEGVRKDVTDSAQRVMEEAVTAFYPQLMPRVDVNDTAPWCWNKDGKWRSLRQFLDDPEFSRGTQAKEEGAERPFIAAQGTFEFVEGIEAAGIELRLLKVAGVEPETAAAGLLLGPLRDEIECAQERAGVLEFEGGLTRARAEAKAVSQVEDRLQLLVQAAGHAQVAMEAQHA